MRSSVIWINGPFGVGKTSVARELVRVLPRSRLVDPEAIGWILQRLTNVTLVSGCRGSAEGGTRDAPDYQDLAAWRRWTVRAIRVASRTTHGAVIVPMTVDDAARRAELLGALREAGLDVMHVTLLGSPATICARLRARGAESAWAERRLDACLAGLAAVEPYIDTDDRSIAEVTEAMRRMFHARQGDASRAAAPS